MINLQSKVDSTSWDKHILDWNTNYNLNQMTLHKRFVQ
jgi:hypothetical protein